MAPMGVHKGTWCWWRQGEECHAEPGKAVRCPVGIFCTGKCPQHSEHPLPSLQALGCRGTSVCTQGWQFGHIGGAASTETALFAFGIGNKDIMSPTARLGGRVRTALNPNRVWEGDADGCSVLNCCPSSSNSLPSVSGTRNSQRSSRRERRGIAALCCCSGGLARLSPGHACPRAMQGEPPARVKREKRPRGVSQPTPHSQLPSACRDKKEVWKSAYEFGSLILYPELLSNN